MEGKHTVISLSMKKPFNVFILEKREEIDEKTIAECADLVFTNIKM